MSDPVAFPVAALSDVAISFYLPQPTGPATTGHSTALQTNYVAIGDVSANVTLAGIAQTDAYYFIANLDVRNPAAEGAIVTLGASITDGVGSAPDSNRRWPNDLAVRLTNGGRTIGVLNQGISGNQLLTDGAGQAALHRFQRDVLSQPGVRWVICSDDPINDLGSANPPSSDRLIAGLAQIISTAHQNGVKFLCSTLTPFFGSAGWTPRGETGRAAFNAFVRSAASGCDGIVDQDVATHDPANAIRFRPAFDSGDHLHPNVAGLQAIADSVNLRLFAGPAGNPGDGGSGPIRVAIADSGGSSSGGASNDSGGNAGGSSADDSGMGSAMGGSNSGSDASTGGAGAGGGGVTSSSNGSQQGAGDAAVSGAGPVATSGCACAAGSDRPSTSAFAALAFGLSLAFARRNRIGRRECEKQRRDLERL
jgi:MYXO-CTERM domain-containing protein